jgi:hypothetical protein
MEASADLEFDQQRDGLVLMAGAVRGCGRRAVLRQIQRRSTEDLTFRVLAENWVPDHVTMTFAQIWHSSIRLRP